LRRAAEKSNLGKTRCVPNPKFAVSEAKIEANFGFGSEVLLKVSRLKVSRQR